MTNFIGRKSLIIEYWQYILPTILTLIVYTAIIKIRNKILTRNTKNANLPTRKQEDSKLDGEEYVQELNFDGENNDLSPDLDEKDHIPFPGITQTLEGGAKKLFKIVNDRRSIRKFSSRQVPFEILEDCIRCAGTSPSGAHTEPWNFCVISDASMRAKVREIIEAEEYLNYVQRMSRQWITDLQPLKTNHIKEYLTDAPHLILIFKKTYGFRKSDGKRKQHYYNEISVSIATGILLCALQAAGLNSLVTTPLNCGPALRNLLQRPMNEKLLVLLPVGYASEDCKVPDIQRKDISEILVRY